MIDWKHVASNLWRQKRQLKRAVRRLTGQRQGFKDELAFERQLALNQEHGFRVARDTAAADLAGAKHKLWLAQQRIAELESSLAIRELKALGPPVPR